MGLHADRFSWFSPVKIVSADNYAVVSVGVWIDLGNPGVKFGLRTFFALCGHVLHRQLVHLYVGHGTVIDSGRWSLLRECEASVPCFLLKKVATCYGIALFSFRAAFEESRVSAQSLRRTRLISVSTSLVVAPCWWGWAHICLFSCIFNLRGLRYFGGGAGLLFSQRMITLPSTVVEQETIRIITLCGNRILHLESWLSSFGVRKVQELCR